MKAKRLPPTVREAGPLLPSMTIMPPTDNETLSRVHVVLCRLETELKHAGRLDDAMALSVADLVVLAFRNAVNAKGLG